MKSRVACLMGTYGRYSLAAEALACFLQQTAIDEAMLLIYNQHPVPLAFEHPRVRVVNETPPHQGLRFIRQRMMELVDEEAIEFYHWWDDDDLYLPWHLADGLDQIGSAPAWKPKWSWTSVRNVEFAARYYPFEGSWLMRADALRAAPIDTHPDYTDHPFMKQMQEAGTVVKVDPGELGSYIYRWGTGTQHLSGYGAGDADKQSADVALWRSRSIDVREDGRLIPADLWPYWRAFLDGVKHQVSTAGYEELEARLSIADSMSKLGALA